MLKDEGGASSSTGAEAPGIRGVKRGQLGNDSPIKVIFFLFSVSGLTDVQRPCSDKVLSESRHSCMRPLRQSSALWRPYLLRNRSSLACSSAALLRVFCPLLVDVRSYFRQQCTNSS